MSSVFCPFEVLRAENKYIQTIHASTICSYERLNSISAAIGLHFGAYYIYVFTYFPKILHLVWYLGLTIIRLSVFVNPRHYSS